MKKYIFTLFAFIVAIVFWMFDSAVHFFIYGEPEFELFPHEFNELWMRSVIVILIVFLGILTDRFTKKIITKERQLEAVNIYSSTLSASQLILNNLLQSMQFFSDEAKSCKDFDPDIIKCFDSSIDQAMKLTARLSQIENITGENISASVDPNNLQDTRSRTNLVDI